MDSSRRTKLLGGRESLAKRGEIERDSIVVSSLCVRYGISLMEWWRRRWMLVAGHA